MRRLNIGAPERLVVLAAAVALAAGACSSAAKSPPSDTTAAPTATPRTGQTTPDTNREVADVLVVRTTSGGFDIVFGGNGETMFELPRGAASQRWQSVATADAAETSTTVRVLRGEGGDVDSETTLPGSWRLPSIGLAGTAGGLSANGKILVLEQGQAGTTSDRRTKFAIVDASGARKPHVITLDGSFSFDTLSPDGSWLYLIEHASNGGPSYQVRRASVSTGRLDETVIVDKRNIDEVMQGDAVTQLASAHGWVYTLYRGEDGAFVHALDTVNGGAFCIDLPDTDGEDDAAVAGWGLALDPRGSSLYAANAETGQVMKIDLGEFVVARQGSIPRQVGAVELAKFENGEWAAAGSAAVDSKGAVLFVAGDAGVAAVRTNDLTLLTRLDAGHSYKSVGVGGSGTVYGVDSHGGLVRLGTLSDPSVQPMSMSRYASIEGVMTLR
jgi:hypothetical protein